VGLVDSLQCPKCGASATSAACVFCGAILHFNNANRLVLASDFRDAALPGLRLNQRMRTELRSHELLVHMPNPADAPDEFGPLDTAAVFADLDAAVTGRFEAIEGDEVPMFALELRTTANVSSYRLSVSPISTFKLTAWVDAKERIFTDWTTHSALKKDAPNRIRLVAKGSHVTAYVNDVLAASIKDDSLASGRAVLCVGPATKTARYTVAFSNLELREPG
jgi:hypothetical protein